jgi:hypothetical protein
VPPPVVQPVVGDLKPALMAAIRERNKVFYSMVVAQAKTIDVEGDTVVFAFAPAQKSLRPQLERQAGWVQELAQSLAGRKMTLVVRESESTPVESSERDAAADRKASLTARAKAEPAVQAVLDVFGGTIEDVEEIS